MLPARVGTKARRRGVAAPYGEERRNAGPAFAGRAMRREIHARSVYRPLEILTGDRTPTTHELVDGGVGIDVFGPEPPAGSNPLPRGSPRAAGSEVGVFQQQGHLDVRVVFRASGEALLAAP